MMIKNYLKTSLRSLFKHKLFSFTNIAGLSIGVLCCLLIMVYVAHEVSYDHWNRNLDRLVRPYADINFGGNVMTMAVTGAPLAPDAAAVLPEIEDWCRFRNYGSYLVKVEGSSRQNISVEHALSVDSTFFNLFPVPMIEGDPMSCLKTPRSVAISQTLAGKLFSGTGDAVGQSLIFDNKNTWKVTAVYVDFPTTNHFKADVLLSLNGNEEIAESPPFWAANNNFHTYFLLREGTDYASFSPKFEKLSREKMEITSSTLLGMSLADFEKTGQYARYPLQKVSDIHLRSNLAVELQPNGDYRYVWIFSAVALFVLLIACINFMNLTTAKSSQRVKEISVRKVMGSSRKQLIFQFLTEAMLMAAFSVVIALIASFFILPWYNDLTGATLSLPWKSMKFWCTVLAGIFVVGSLAGSYPAFFLSSFQPVQVLRDSGKGKGRDEILRNSLVVFQFVIATTLIIGTFLIYRQLNYIQNKKVGFQKEQIIVVNDTYTLGDQIEAYKEEMLQNPSIRSATVSSYLPIPSSRSNSTYSKARELREDLAINIAEWRVDYDYLDTYGMQIKEGRFFDKSFGMDSTAVVVNEAAIKILGFENPIGKKIYGMDGFSSAPAPDDFIEYTIVGVVEDFHFESLRDNIGALAFFLGKSTGNISFAFQPGSTANIVSALESKWHQMAPDQPFSYRFVDDSFRRMYEAESRTGGIIMVFAILAILVSCLGLFGLSTFVVEQRTKEIGIRKVLGANIANIVGLLSRRFLLLVFIGIILAIPLAWYFLNGWLANFAYRVELDWSLFLAAATVAILIAFFTVSFQSIKAAIMSPSRALRSE